MMRALVTAAGLAMFLVGCSAAPARAQHDCGQRAKVIEKLADRYGESLHGSGLRDSKSLFEVWVDETDGSWTIILSLPDGSACVIAFGQHWNGQPRGTAIRERQRYE